MLSDIKKIPKWKLISFVVIAIGLAVGSGYKILPYIESGDVDQGTPPTYGIETTIEF